MRIGGVLAEVNADVAVQARCARGNKDVPFSQDPLALFVCFNTYVVVAADPIPSPENVRIDVTEVVLAGAIEGLLERCRT